MKTEEDLDFEDEEINVSLFVRKKILDIFFN